MYTKRRKGMHANRKHETTLSNIGYKILGKHIVYSDKQLGGGYPFLYEKEEKLIKITAIILFSMMTMTCKITFTKMQHCNYNSFSFFRQPFDHSVRTKSGEVFLLACQPCGLFLAKNSDGRVVFTTK